MSTTYDSSTDIVLGDADLSVGSGQLGKAVFLTLAADTTADSLGIVYDSYVITTAGVFNFDLPTATSGYKARVTNLGPDVINVRTNAGVPVRELQADSAAWFQLVSPPGPQDWGTVGAESLNEAYKAGTTGIILRDATRQAVKVSSAPAPALSDSLLVASALRGGLEASSLEVGNEYVELLCANGAGVLDKNGFNVAIDATLPIGSSNTIVSKIAPGGACTNSVLLGPMTLPHGLSNSLAICPTGSLTMPSTPASNSVVLGPASTFLQQNGPTANSQFNAFVIPGANINAASIQESAIFGSQNVINSPLIQYPNLTLIGNENSLSNTVLDNSSITMVGSQNTMTNIGTVNNPRGVIVGSVNQTTNLQSGAVIVGNTNQILSTLSSRTIRSVMLMRNSNILTSNALTSVVGGAIASTIDSFLNGVMLVNQSTLASNGGGDRPTVAVGTLLNYTASTVNLSMFGTQHTIPSGTYNRTLMVGNVLTLGNLSNQSCAIFGNGISSTKQNSLIFKPDFNADGVPLVSATTNGRSTAVVFARDFRWSDSDSGFNTNVTVNLDQEGTSGSTTGFDGVFQHKRMFPRFTTAAATTTNVNMTGALTASNQSLGVELKINIIEPATGNTMFYTAVVNYYVQGASKLVSPPVANIFSRITPSPTVTFTVIDGGATYTPVIQVVNPTANPIESTIIADFTQIRA